MRSATSRHVASEANREFVERPRTVRALKPRATDAGAAAAAVDLVNELLSQNVVSADAAQRALERLRVRARAVTAAVWSVTETVASCALSVGDSTPGAGSAVVELRDPRTVIERLRRHDAVICHSGEVSGLEDLVPEGVRSFVVAASPKLEDGLPVLVVGWDTLAPRCDESAVAHLRIAAALLHRALATGPSAHPPLADAILGSLADRIAVLDRNGLMIAANAAWTMSSPEQAPDSCESIGPGASYFDVCRRAAANGSLEAASILEGLRAVTRGDADFVQAAYPFYELGEEQWGVLTATPLQHADGGTVVAHTHLTSRKVTELARPIGLKLFYRLADVIPAPIWILSPEGRLIHGNTRWAEIADGEGARTPETREWTDVFHPDDREEARAAFRAALLDRASFQFELRLRMGHGTYRWSECIGAPYVTSDGRLEGYVGFCGDISAQRRTESALIETASKLIAAQEAERSRIGRELHDDIGQRAALLAAKLETLARDRRASSDLRAGLADAQDSVQDLAVAIHDLSHQLHSAKLRLLGLVTTLEALCRDVSKENSVKVNFKARSIPSTISEPITLCVYRVAQEALQNAVKHSAAREIDVRLAADGSRLTLRVKDNGHGFDPRTSETSGIGLLTMRERVELSGGQMTIKAAAARGTTIDVVLPLVERSSGAA